MQFNELACQRTKEYILIRKSNLQGLGEIFKWKSDFCHKHNIKLEKICNTCHSSVLGGQKHKARQWKCEAWAAWKWRWSSAKERRRGPLGTDRRAEGRQTNILIRRSAQEAVLWKCCKYQTHTHTRNRLTEFPYGVQYFKHIISFEH